MKVVKMANQREKYPEERGEPGDREKRMRWLDRISDAFTFLWVAIAVFFGMW
ncbi:MAG: hypothetical protein Q7S99_08110 [Parvibaculum sp.]|nr:hypothetical protein [Parvibaculum sp.]